MERSKFGIPLDKNQEFRGFVGRAGAGGGGAVPEAAEAEAEAEAATVDEVNSEWVWPKRYAGSTTDVGSPKVGPHVNGSGTTGAAGATGTDTVGLSEPSMCAPDAWASPMMLASPAAAALPIPGVAPSATT